MESYILMKKNEDAEMLSHGLGFSKSLFLAEGFILVKGKSEQELLHQIQEAKNKKLKTIYKAESEKMLRFVLEKSQVDILYGMETINPKDSTHYVRSGLDQILCSIAKEKGKIIAISFAELLHSEQRGRLLARMMFNVKLCKKYKVPVLITNFASSVSDLRSAKDLEAFGRILRI
ncbi:MAG: RNase P subunit p30 family protein [Nanoarchaeota archaeon]